MRTINPQGNMFNEDEDWNDEEEAKVLSKTVLRDNLKSNSSSTVKTKVVGKKSLLRTLQTLGSVPDWKRDEHRQESDSDTEAAVSPCKKKKKRRKRQKRADALGEQQENGELEESNQEEQAVSKKRKKGNKFDVSKVKTTTEIKTKDNGVAEKVNVSMSATLGGLSRKKWKNKMKNKRKCKNKYRSNKPEEEVNEAQSAEKIKPVERVKTESCNNNNNTDNQKPAKRMGKECKPQKRKKSDAYIFVECPTKTQTVTEETNMEEKVRRSSEAESVGDQEKLSRQGQKPQLSSKQRLKREKLRKMLHSQETDQQEHLSETTDEQVLPEGEEEKLDRSASLRSRMEQRLESARFRYLNEVLYSTSSGEAKRMFKQDPQAFWIYHRGYTAQVERWPANPVDEIIAYIRQKPFSLVVADFGCGDCKIARSVKNKVHSFDLAAACELVTVCDMASVPLPDASVDIVVFCLSLMGTNLADFLAEASRVLKMGGFLKIAEVASRFENVRSFITALTNLGFKMVSKDTQNTHFYSFELVKTGDAPENIKKFGLQLRPCVYKKR